MKESKKNKARQYIFMAIGFLFYVFGFITMDGYIELRDGLTLAVPCGLAISSLGVDIMILSWCFWKFETYKEKIQILEGRADYLEDKIYSGSGGNGKDN